MATVTAFIRTTKADKNKSVNVRFRLRDGRGFQLFHKSKLTVFPDKWDDKQQKLKARCIIDEQERKNYDKAITDRKDLIKDIYLQKGKVLTSETLDTEIEKVLYPEQYEQPKQTFFDAFDEYLEVQPLSEARKRSYQCLKRALQRFELFTQKTVKGQRNFKLDIETITADTLKQFENFLIKEHTYFTEYPELYKEFPEHRPNKPRGTNTLACMFSRLRAFCNWCNKKKKISNKPFADYDKPTETYGTPYYITIEERNQLYEADLSHRPGLAAQRDIFVFQCLIGCRVGDLYKFTKQNVINGAIEYIAGKTKDDKPKTLRVPLNAVARQILEKYADLEGNRLLPYISEQKYNEAIKEAFTIAGLTRNVTILNPFTRESEIKQLNEIASTHLARRTFCGNLYKKVKDPNLVGKLSGHVEGSRAFVRYRDIDEEDKIELVKMLE